VKLDLPRRVALFATAILVVSAALGWRAWVAWGETGRLANLGPTLEAGQELAEHYKAQVLEMNHALARYGVTGIEDERERFSSTRNQLRTWLKDQSSNPTRLPNPAVLSRIQAAFSAFEADADQLLATRAAGSTGVQPTKLIDELEQDSRALLALAQELDDVHRNQISLSLAEAEKSVSTLQNFTLGSLATLLGLMACLGFFVWRDLIAPLRSRLQQSRLALEQREKLASLGVLAAGVAHEIRNPLTSIKARAFTLSRLLRHNSDEHGDAVVISSEIARLERIVDDFLRFSKPTPPCPSLVQSGSTFRELAALLGPDLERRQLRIDVSSTDDTAFPADPAQLRQVLLNLLRNAMDASKPGSAITLSAHRGNLRIDRQVVPIMTLAVSDRGTGIPPEVQRRLFDPFFTTKPSGTGLGLSISARIVEAHGGSLAYQTAPNRGTTFFVHLPLVAQPREVPVASVPNSSVLHAT
jgi:signal transduction histidine kinase